MRGSGAVQLVPRPGLQRRLASAPLVVLEAPGGYGKSTTCAALAQSLDLVTVRLSLPGPTDLPELIALLARALRRAGLAEVASALSPESPPTSAEHLASGLAGLASGALLSVDEVQLAAPAALDWLAEVVDALPPPVRAAVAGRRVGSRLAAIAGSGAALLLGVDDLRFGAEEVAAVLAVRLARPPSPHEVDAVLVATDGWPAAVALAAERVARLGVGALAPLTGGGEVVLRRLLDDLLGAADERTRLATAQLALLPLLSAEVAAAVDGPGSLDRLLDAGVPVRFRADGWGELADPVRDVLRRSGEALPTPVLRAVAATYAGHGEVAEAVALLHRGDDGVGVVEVLARCSRRELVALGSPLLVALLAAVPDAALVHHPTVLVEAARAAESDPVARRAVLARGEAVLSASGAARRAIDAERALDLERTGALEQAAGLAADVLAATEGSEIVTRARAHAARGLAMVLLDTVGAAGEPARHFEEAAALFALAGEREWEASAHVYLGYGCLFTAGALDLAAERIELALSLVAAPSARRGDLLTFAADVLTHVGHLDAAEAALREAGTIGRRLGDQRILGYVAWSNAELAFQRRDRAGAVAALAEAERHPGEWLDSLAGVDFLAHAAEIRFVLGDLEGAASDLERAEDRARGTERSEAAAGFRARWEATVGDAGHAELLLDALDRNPLAYARDRCLRSLLRSVAAHRRGDAAATRSWLATAHADAAALGDPDRLARREPELLAIVADGDVGLTYATKVVLLGGFAVVARSQEGEVDVTPPPGRPATLVKVLAIRGTIAVDEAIDLLWPDVDDSTGRTRLRNVLNRLRTASGPLVERVEGGVRLVAGTEIDLDRFERACAAALTAPPERRAGLARSALARHTGELLPADRYSDWAAGVRERIRRRHLALLDLLADDATARGDLDEAVRLLDEAIATEPLDERRSVRAVQVLLAQGRWGAARDVARRAAAVADDLGLAPGADLDRLLRELLSG